MKRTVKAIQNIDNVLGKIAIMLTVVLTILMLLLSLTEVIRRYLFDLSFPWSEELLRYMLIWLVFTGAAAAYQKDRMINVDLLLSKTSPQVKSIFLLIVDIVSLIFLSFLTYLAIKRVSSPTVVKRISATLKVSMSYAYAAPVAGLGLMAFSSLAKLPVCINNVKSAFSGRKTEREEASVE